MTYIYLDENLSKYVATALNYLNKGYFTDVEIFSTEESFSRGISDEDLIPKISKKDGVIITRDLNITKTKLQYALLKDNKIGAFFIKLPKNMDKHWLLIRILINNWEEIIGKSKNKRKPFAYELQMRGQMKEL